jgi:hypothetical protein
MGESFSTIWRALKEGDIESKILRKRSNLMDDRTYFNRKKLFSYLYKQSAEIWKPILFADEADWFHHEFWENACLASTLLVIKRCQGSSRMRKEEFYGKSFQDYPLFRSMSKYRSKWDNE